MDLWIYKQNKCIGENKKLFTVIKTIRKYQSFTLLNIRRTLPSLHNREAAQAVRKIRVAHYMVRKTLT